MLAIIAALLLSLCPAPPVHAQATAPDDCDRIVATTPDEPDLPYGPPNQLDASSTPNPYTFVPLDLCVDILAPPGTWRAVWLLSNPENYPDLFALRVTISNRGNHDAGLWWKADGNGGGIIASPRHRASGRLLVDRDNGWGFANWLSGNRAAHLIVHVTGAWQFA